MSTARRQATTRDQAPLLEVRELKRYFPVRKGIFSRTAGYVYAVDGVSLTIRCGETLGLVGESGCGKSAAGKTILKLLQPTSGTIRLRGSDITPLNDTQMGPYRREMQIVFQDPYLSLNPRMSAGAIVGEPLASHGVAAGQEKDDRVAGLRSGSGSRPTLRPSIRTSSPAGSASGSASPSRWRSTRA
jgi:ABC-type microcin C transport system duplicated ATPase subunit YejF